MPPRKRSSSTRRRSYSGPKRRRSYSSYRRTYRGRGAYKGSAPKTASYGRMVGSGLGALTQYIPGVGKAIAPVATYAGAKIGQYLGGKLGEYMGWGAYSVTSNSLLVPEGNSPAAMHTSGSTVRISHREYISGLYASGDGTDTQQVFVLNPGNPLMFPWLSGISRNFQKYKIHGAIVEFKSLSGPYQAGAGASSSLGDIVIASNYNCADPPFTSRQQMENTQFSSSVKPTKCLVHIIECDPRLQAQNQLYVATTADGSANSGLTTNEANWCNVTIATFGTQAAGAPFLLGNIYITYDVELIYPIDRTVSNVLSSTWFNADANEPRPLGDVSTIVGNDGNSLPCNITNGPNYNLFTFPTLQSGLYLVQWSCNGAAPGDPFTAPSFTNFTNCLIASGIDVAGTPLNYAAPANGVVTSVVSCTMAFRVLAPTPSFRFGGGNWRNGPCRLIITQLDYDLV